jgi:hypothetical protein
MLLVGNPKGNRLLGRQKRGWVDNIKMDVGEINGVTWDGLVWIRIGAKEGCCIEGN